MAGREGRLEKMSRPLFLFVILCYATNVCAQHTSDVQHLRKEISINVRQQPLGQVLDLIAAEGNFYFSYSGAAVKTDSLVSLSATDQRVGDVLDRIFQGRADYRTAGRYLIIRSTELRFQIRPETIRDDKRHYLIAGQVLDASTSRPVENASVYEKRLLTSALTDERGNFRMRVRGEHKSLVLTFSKDLYRDTSLLFLPGITIKPEGYSDDGGQGASYASNIVERLGVGRFLVSAKRRIQSLNISGFMASSPYQASVLPGLSSHGMFSSQVVNKASLNIFGGYTAGVNGVEVAGLFNINKQDVRHFQAAGLTNLVGGSMTGFQAAGILNSVLDTANGFQAAGVINDVRSNANGWQAAGVFNHVRKDFHGIQSAGVANLVSGSASGLQVSGVINMAGDIRGSQVAGIINFSRRSVSGAQIGLLNYAKSVKGFQVGLINLADSSAGASFGLINWVTRGYNKFSISSTDVFPYQVAIKTGTHNFYTILLASANLKQNQKAYAAGFGFGHDLNTGRALSGSAEVTSQGVYLGNWNSRILFSKVQADLQLRLVKGVSLFAGPSFNIYNNFRSGQGAADGFKALVRPGASGRQNNWIGWNVGLTLF